LIAAMRLVWMTALAVGLGEGAFAVAAPVPGEHAWARDGAYVYRVRVESQEAKYLPSLRGEVVYFCRAANPHGFTLRCHNFLTLQRHSNEGRRFPPFGVFQLGWKFFDGSNVGRVPRPPVDVVFDTRGKRLVRAGAPARDFDLTDPSLLVVHRFAPKGTNEWTVTEQVRLVHEQRFVRAGEEGFVRIKKTPLIGTLRIKYHREAEELAQSLILETPNTPGQPRIRLAGKGTTTFSASGIPVKFSWEGKLTDHNGQTERTLPVTIHYELLTGNAREKALRPAAPTTRAERRPLNEGELPDILENLPQRMTFRRALAVKRLAAAEPSRNPVERAKAAKGLAAALRDPDPFLRADAARALANWGDPASVPPLIALLKDSQTTARWAAIDALGSLRDPRAIAPLIAHLETTRELFATANALAHLGARHPDAELQLAPLFKSKNSVVRLEVCRLLTVFGTDLSKPALTKAAADANKDVAQAAAVALEKIRARGE
jgi:YHS domain-containing protein